jgi:hypothetical protein
LAAHRRNCEQGCNKRASTHRSHDVLSQTVAEIKELRRRLDRWLALIKGAGQLHPAYLSVIHVCLDGESFGFANMRPPSSSTIFITLSNREQWSFCDGLDDICHGEVRRDKSLDHVG